MKNRLYITIISLILITIKFSYGQVHLEPVCAETIEEYGVSGYPGSEFVWSVEGGIVIEGDGTDSVLIQWGYNTGNYKIEVLEITNESCYGVPSVAEIEVMAPYLDLGYENPEFCSGDSMVFNAGGNYQEPYELTWQNGSNADEYIAFASEEIWARVIDGYGCIRYDTVNLTMRNLPEVNLGNDTIICDFENPMTIYANKITDINTWEASEWRLSNNIPDYNQNYILEGLTDQADTLKVTITNIYGCENSDILVILACDFARLFKEMPNSITPNGDGENDVWNIPYMDIFDKAVLEVFDRWGRLVFRTDNVYENPWDGKSKGKILPMDSYYFVIDLKLGNAQPIVGTVNLIR